MFSALANLFMTSATPSPSPTRDLSNLSSAGPLTSALFVVLAFALIVLLFSMNRHLKRVSFNEDSDNK